MAFTRAMSKDVPSRARTGLTSPRWGVVCAVLTAVWCALGSLLYQLVPQLYRFRLWHSWSAPRWHTVSVYVLLAILAVWFVNGALRLRSLRKDRDRRSAGSRSRFVLAVLELGSVLGLSVYVWLVVRPPQEEFLVTEKGANIHGEFYRVTRIEEGNYEAIPCRPTRVWLERRVGAVSHEFRVERWRFWASTTGAYDLVVARAQMSTDGVVLRHGTEQVALSKAKPQPHADGTLRLRRIWHRDTGRSARVPEAEIRIGAHDHSVPLDPEWPGQNAFLGPNESPVCLVKVHRNLCVPLAIIAVALLAGLALVGHLAQRTERSAR